MQPAEQVAPNSKGMRQKTLDQLRHPILNIARYVAWLGIRNTLPEVGAFEFGMLHLRELQVLHRVRVVERDREVVGKLAYC